MTNITSEEFWRAVSETGDNKYLHEVTAVARQGHIWLKIQTSSALAYVYKSWTQIPVSDCFYI
jgi:hypothetical protein